LFWHWLYGKIDCPPQKALSFSRLEEDFHIQKYGFVEGLTGHETQLIQLELDVASSAFFLHNLS
jgi:hypothetical protein